MVLTVDILLSSHHKNNSRKPTKFINIDGNSSKKHSSLDYDFLNLTTSGKMLVNDSYGSSSNCMYAGHYCSENDW